MRVAVIDSGGANIGSVRYALERLGVDSVLTADARVIAQSERVILPGVGTAAVAMAPAGDGSIQDNPDPATESRYQADIARTLTMVPGITRAYWLTRATLVIDRTGTHQLVWPFICGELERYPSLRTVRVQLNPRPDSDDQVRWRQCRTV